MIVSRTTTLKGSLGFVGRVGSLNKKGLVVSSQKKWHCGRLDRMTRVLALPGDDVERLEKENGFLREVAKNALFDMDPEQREMYLDKYAKLMEEAVNAGVELSFPWADDPEIPVTAAPIQPEQPPSNERGSSPRPEFNDDGSVTFSFHPKALPAHVNSLANAQLQTNISRRKSRIHRGNAQRRYAARQVTGKDKTSGQQNPAAGSSDQPTTNKSNIAPVSGANASNGNATKTLNVEEEFRNIKYTSNGIPIGVWPDSTDTDSGLSEDEKAALRVKCKAAIAATNIKQVLKDKFGWQVFTVPQKPVAGAPCQVYFNKDGSDTLRHANRVQIQYSFNQWELEGEKIDCKQLKVEGAQNWWWCEVPVLKEAFEINAVFSNGENLFDNNHDNNYLFQAEGGLTQDEWADVVTNRLKADLQLKKEADLKQKLDDERQRQKWIQEVTVTLARERVEKLKTQLDRLRNGSMKSMTKDGKMVFKTKPQQLEAGEPGVLLYNRKAGPFANFPIPDDQKITLKYGSNNWDVSKEVEMERVKPDGGEGKEDWYQAKIEVPEDSVSIDFVLNYYEHWDNNETNNYRIKVDDESTVEELNEKIDAMLPKYMSEELQKLQAQEDATKRKQETKQSLKKQAQEQAHIVLAKQMKHVMYTEPVLLKAGGTVTIYYNPSNTSLNGRSEVYLTGGWNRWTHRKKFGPIKMTPPGDNGQHFRASIRIPQDANLIDMVFSDVPEGDGTYDNKGGLDYHLPIEGSLAKEQGLHVCHVAVEMAPICKVGGLGDVVTSLGRAVQDQGHLVEVVLPKYSFLSHSPVLGSMQFETEFDYGGTHVYVTTCIVEDLRCFFIEPQNGMFDHQAVYVGLDDMRRFDFFSQCALEFLLKTGRQPDIIHGHDWSTAAVAKYYWTSWHQNGLWRPRCVFTIHNLDFGQVQVGESAFHCQWFTTVSPSYAFEISGHDAVRPHTGKFMGIRNGIDLDLWNPLNDQFLPVQYDYTNMVEGKAAARKQLRERLGLSGYGDKPLIGVVSRLTAQKGMDLIKHAGWRTLDRSGQFVLLGSAPDPKVQASFDAFAQDYQSDNAAFVYSFDEPLSHLLYAACDAIVVPSMFEPCGLTQLIAMRYGAVPVVRHTGGLRDTVFDVDSDKDRAAWEMQGEPGFTEGVPDETNGFAFDGTDTSALDYALERCIDAWYNDRVWFTQLQQRIMKQDWSWNRPALQYIELYYSARKS